MTNYIILYQNVKTSGFHCGKRWWMWQWQWRQADVENYTQITTINISILCFTGHVTFLLCNKQHKRHKLREKKHSEETQTLGPDFSKAEPKLFTLPQTPFPGARTVKI